LFEFTGFIFWRYDQKNSINLKKLNIKILGSGPTGSLLALALANNNCTVTLEDPLEDHFIKLRDKAYAITHSSRRILNKLDLWNEISKQAKGFSSLALIDAVNNNYLLFNKDDLLAINSTQNNVGWVIEHTHLMDIILNRIRNNSNIKRIISTDIYIQNDNYDYIFAADGKDSSTRKLWNINYFKRFYNQDCISFKVLLRTDYPYRAYEILREDGPLALLPLKENIYQIIWFAPKLINSQRINYSKSHLLDVLASFLPDNIQPDIILSDIYRYPVTQSFIIPDFRLSNKILLGDSAHSFHPVGGQGLNSCWRDVYEINNMIEGINNKSYIVYNFSFRFYLKRFLDIFSLIVFTDLIIKTFSNNHFLINPFKKLVFKILSSSKYIKKRTLSLMTDSLSNFGLY
tara:strand:- start:16288 stop:17493 length:1206 start_codon:yes stop_codon:yes gene_type:complete